MNNKTQNVIMISVGILFFVGMFSLFAVGRNNSISEVPTTYSASALSAFESMHNFGTISMGNGNVNHEFKIENSGTEPVSIQKVYTSCMCTKAYITDASGRRHGAFGMPGHGLPSRTSIEVSPGESIVVKAVFDPAAHGMSGIGLAERSVYLETNSSENPNVELAFKAMVTR